MTAPADDGSAGFTAAPMRARTAPADQTLSERHKAAVERLERIADLIVAELDLIYGEPDLEDSADAEPTLGAPEPMGAGGARLDQRRWADGYEADGQPDEREIDDDNEPSLGSVGNAHANAYQPQWTGGATSSDDRERDDSEAEASLGWAEGVDQSWLGASSEEIEYVLGSANPTTATDQTHWGDRNAGWGGGDAEEQCEDDGHDDDLEPDYDGEPDDDALCNWQDDGDQTVLVQHRVYIKPVPGRRPSWAKTSGDILPVRVLESSTGKRTIVRLGGGGLS